VREKVLDHCMFVVSPAFFPVAATFVFVETSAFVSASRWTRFGFIRVLHLESWREIDVKRAEDNLAYERAKIDNRVVDFVSILC
jgi:hypothetical protein